MLQLLHKEYLYLLILIPIMLLIFLFEYKRRQEQRKILGEDFFIKKMSPYESQIIRIWKYVFLLLAIVFLILALINPQMGTKTEKVKRKGVDVMIALDVSNSMMAQDLEPNRLERSKQFVFKLIEKLQNDRVGLVIFAGDAYLQMPLTNDYSSAKMFLHDISPGSVPSQGTNLGAAIEKSVSSFVTDDEDKSKTIVLISDGENHEDGLSDEISAAKSKGIKIFTVGVGSDDGAKIPLDKSKNNFLKDEDGKEVVSKMNSDDLENIANETQATYFHFTGKTEEINKMVNNIAKIDKKDYDEVVFSEFKSWYQWLLGIAFVFILLIIVLPDRKWKL